MFNWLRRWHRNRQRAIFQFWDGRAYRFVDPLVAFQLLKGHPSFEMERDLTGHDMGHEDSTRACILATRAAFGVTAFDGAQSPSGLTEAETTDLLATFGDWMQAVKKNIRTPLISSADSSLTPLPAPYSMAPGSSIVDSHSTCVESSCAAPPL